MNKIKVIINSVVVKDDYDTDPNLLITAEVDTELEDIIPSMEMELVREVWDVMELNQSQVVEVFSGEPMRRIFYGHIMEIKEMGAKVKIQASMETSQLLRVRVNKIYTSSEAHQGRNELIFKDLGERAGLTVQVEPPMETNIIAEFKCIHAVIYERQMALMKAIDYQMRYDPETRILRYEPRGFVDNNKEVTTDREIVGLPEWKEHTDGMINNLRIDGATTETQITETGTIGTTSGWTANSILLTKTPNIVELIVDGVQRVGGTKDASTAHYYWVDRENRRIMPRESTTFPANVARVNYSWSAPAPVQDFRQDSIDKYGLFEEVLNFTDISSVRDAEQRIEKLLDARASPFKTVKIETDTELEIGELVSVVDEVSYPPKRGKYVVVGIKRKYPSGFDEVILGDKEWKLEDDIVEMESRIKRLEENFIRNQDILLQLVRIQDGLNENLVFPRERYLMVLEKNIGGEGGIYGNSDFGIYGVSKYGSEADQSFILGKGKLGLNALGSKISEEVLKFLAHHLNKYIEDFTDEEFIDSSSTATIEDRFIWL